MTDAERDRFDELLDGVLAGLPSPVVALLDEVPLIVLDEPTPAMLRDLGVDREDWEEEASLLCGLHSGVSRMERSVEASGELPEQIHLFRRGVIAAAGGWHGRRSESAVSREIRITLLHEIGHHFGLEEDDLDRLGYG